MARRPRRKTLENKIADLLKKQQPVLRNAFLTAIQDIANQADLGRIIERIEAGDIIGAVNAVHLDLAAFQDLEAAIAATYNAGGVATTESLPVLRDASGYRIVMRFDARIPRAEKWVRNYSSTEVTRVTDDQRVMIREVLEIGVRDGRNPRNIALDITGRLNRKTGNREGGLIGLTREQAQYVTTAREELLSGNPDMLRNYLARKRRSKGPGGIFERRVLEAIDKKQPLPTDLVERMVRDYKSSLLQLRGETIARLEAKASLHEATQESYRQAVDSGGVKEQEIKRTWDHVGGGEDSRLQHIAMSGQTVGLNEPFIAPDGTRIMYPNDPNAPIKHTANCRCQARYTIDFLARLE